MTSKQSFSRFLCAFVGVALLSGCGASDEERGPEPDLIPRSGDLRVYNAIVDSPDLQVSITGGGSGSVVFSGVLAFDNTIVSNYRVNVGYFDAQNSFIPIVNNLEVPIHEDFERTIVLTGTLANPVITVLANEEFLFGFLTPPVQNPEVQFVNAANGSGTLDFHLTAPADPLTTATASLALRAASAIRKVAPGDYRLRVTPAGQPGTVLFDSGTVALVSTSRESHFAVNYVGPGGPGIRVIRVVSGGIALPFPNEALSASIRFGNLAADLAEADLYFGDPATTAPIFEDVPFGAFTPYLDLPAGTQSIRITAANSSDPVLHTQSATLLSGNFSTFYIGGLVSNPAMAGAFTIDDNRIVGVRTQVRLFNGSPAAGTVNVFLLVPGQTTTSASATFPAAAVGASGATRLPPGPYDLVVENLQGVSLFGPDRVQVESGVRHILTVTDTAGGGPPFAVSFGVDP